MVILRFSFEEKSNVTLGKLLKKLLKLNIGCYLCPGMWELLASSNPINVGQTSVLFYENSPLRCSNGVRGGRENLNVTRLCFCKEASARVSLNTHSKKKQSFLMLLCLSKKRVKRGLRLLHPTNCPGAALCKLCVHEKTYYSDGFIFFFNKNRNF